MNKEMQKEFEEKFNNGNPVTNPHQIIYLNFVQSWIDKTALEEYERQQKQMPVPEGNAAFS